MSGKRATIRNEISGKAVDHRIFPWPSFLFLDRSAPRKELLLLDDELRIGHDGEHLAQGQREGRVHFLELVREGLLEELPEEGDLTDEHGHIGKVRVGFQQCPQGEISLAMVRTDLYGSSPMPRAERVVPGCAPRFCLVRPVVFTHPNSRI